LFFFSFRSSHFQTLFPGSANFFHPMIFLFTILNFVSKVWFFLQYYGTPLYELWVLLNSWNPIRHCLDPLKWGNFLFLWLWNF
jgi:hypothetical protein